MEQTNQTKETKKISKLFMILIALFLFLILLSFFSVNSKISKLNETIDNLEIPVFNETESITTGETSYLVKEFQGKIGVYKNNDFQYLLDVFVFTLPDQDKKLLSQGITVSSEQELNALLSTYY